MKLRSVSLVVLVVLCVAAGAAASPANVRSRTSHAGGLVWPTFGRTQHRTFTGDTTLTSATAPTLMRRWFVPAGLPVTATPIVANGTVYVGSWDGKFRAIALSSGDMRWTFKVKSQPAISPDPSSSGPSPTSDGGIITSSAIYVPASSAHPALVIFGGGYTLYALRAATGTVFWEHDYTGNPAKAPDPANDETRIFTSPAVVGNHVLFGTTNDGQGGYHAYFASAGLRTGNPQWEFQTDVDAHGHIANNGCNGVWASPTVDTGHGLVYFDTADCDGTDNMPYAEKVLALHYRTGRLAWSFKPPRPDNGCDWDFGATANFRPAGPGRPAFLGVGGKDGTYYSIAPGTGKLRWKRNVVFGGTSGGFIGTTALAGTHVYGATAIGDLGGAPCDPSNPGDQQMQEPSMHAFDVKTGAIAWQQEGSQAVGATTVAGGMTFVCTAFNQQVQIRNKADGSPVFAIPLQSGCNSGVVVAGNMVIFGEGEAENPQHAGVSLYTPNAEAPKP